MNNLTKAVKHLLIINVVMFIGAKFVGDGQVFYDWFAMHFPESKLFKPWQILTHMFMHGNEVHLLFNMFALWMFGVAVETRLTTKRFILFYMLCGLGAVVASVMVDYVQFYNLNNSITHLNLDESLLSEILSINAREDNLIKGSILFEKMTPIFDQYSANINSVNDQDFKTLFNLNVLGASTMVGASGAIMGILVAFGVFYPNTKLMLIFLPIPIKAKYFIPLLLGYEIIAELFGGVSIFGMQIAHTAHIGGALTGFILMLIWRNKFKRNSFN